MAWCAGVSVINMDRSPSEAEGNCRFRSATSEPMRNVPPGRRAIWLSTGASAANKTLLRLIMSLSTVQRAFGWPSGPVLLGIEC